MEVFPVAAACLLGGGAIIATLRASKVQEPLDDLLFVIGLGGIVVGAILLAYIDWRVGAVEILLLLGLVVRWKWDAIQDAWPWERKRREPDREPLQEQEVIEAPSEFEKESAPAPLPDHEWVWAETEDCKDGWRCNLHIVNPASVPHRVLDLSLEAPPDALYVEAFCQVERDDEVVESTTPTPVAAPFSGPVFSCFFPTDFMDADQVWPPPPGHYVILWMDAKTAITLCQQGFTATEKGLFPDE